MRRRILYIHDMYRALTFDDILRQLCRPCTTTVCDMRHSLLQDLEAHATEHVSTQVCTVCVYVSYAIVDTTLSVTSSAHLQCLRV